MKKVNAVLADMDDLFDEIDERGLKIIGNEEMERGKGREL